MAKSPNLQPKSKTPKPKTPEITDPYGKKVPTKTRKQLLKFVMEELICGTVLVVENVEVGYLYNDIGQRYNLDDDVWDEVLGWDCVEPVIKRLDHSLWIFKHTSHLKYIPTA